MLGLRSQLHLPNCESWFGDWIISMMHDEKLFQAWCEDHHVKVRWDEAPDGPLFEIVTMFFARGSTRVEIWTPFKEVLYYTTTWVDSDTLSLL